MGKVNDRRLRDFSAAYIETMDPARAAQMVGFDPGEAMELMENSRVTERLDRYRQLTSRQICAEDVIRRLVRLAFGPANDCVKLVMEQEPDIDGLQLDLLSELKRGANGVVEIRLADRVKALERLMELLAGNNNEAAAFLQALTGGMED